MFTKRSYRYCISSFLLTSTLFLMPFIVLQWLLRSCFNTCFFSCGNLNPPQPHARVNPAFAGASTANLHAVPDPNQPEVYDEEANIRSNSISISIQQRSSLTGISAVNAIPVGLADEHVYVEDGFYDSAATGGGRNNSNSNATYANTGAGVQTGSIYNTLQSARSNGRSSNTNTANPRSPSFGTPPSLTLTSSGSPRGPGQDQGGTSA